MSTRTARTRTQVLSCLVQFLDRYLSFQSYRGKIYPDDHDRFREGIMQWIAACPKGALIAPRWTAFGPETVERSAVASATWQVSNTNDRAMGFWNNFSDRAAHQVPRWWHCIRPVTAQVHTRFGDIAFDLGTWMWSYSSERYQGFSHAAGRWLATWRWSMENPRRFHTGGISTSATLPKRVPTGSTQRTITSSTPSGKEYGHA